MDPLGILSEPTLNTGDLATIAGASAAAMIVAQFAKRLLNTTPAVTRAIAMLTGLVILTASTVLANAETTVLGVVLAVVVGMQAGLAAAALVDNVREGLAHETFPAGTQASPLIGLAIEDAGEPVTFETPAAGADPDPEA